MFCRLTGNGSGWKTDDNPSSSVFNLFFFVQEKEVRGEGRVWGCLEILRGA